MPATPAEIFERLARMRQRLTRTRRAVIQALHAAARPVTARELHQAVGDVDLVTVYRTAAWLVGLGVAREVSAGAGGERFELVDTGVHTHHLRCDRCGKLITVPICGLDTAVFARIDREHGFLVQDHRLTFHGLCAECRAEVGA